MMRTIFLSFACAVVLVAAASAGGAGASRSAVPPDGILRFTVLYDNYLYREGTRADWGFSCLIEGTEKTILFDTGTNPEILMHNVDLLGVDLKKVGLVVISHNHGDHTGGLPAVLERNSDVTVFYPVSFPADFGANVKKLGARFETVGRAVEICRGVHLTGEMGDAIKEQSLIIDAARGLVVVTGCSHPGVVSILERAREVVDRPIDLVFGGFHLGGASPSEMETIIAGFKSLGVARCGATHCTGDAQIAMFKKAFGDNYVPVGTGRVIEVPLR